MYRCRYVGHLTLTKLRLFFHCRKLQQKTLFLTFCQFVASKGLHVVCFLRQIAIFVTECQLTAFFVAKVFFAFFYFFHSQ